jgi:Uma2 family endonuclease
MVATRPVSIEEFARMSGDGSWELIDGELVAVNPAAVRSSRIGGRFYSRLEAFVDGGILGWAYPADAGFILFADRATVRSPDAAVVLKGRVVEEPDGFMPVPPDLAVEVLSPSDRIADALAKIAMYFEAGVRLVWLVNPATKLVTVFRPDADASVLGVGDVLDGGEVLPGFSIPVADIFI